MNMKKEISFFLLFFFNWAVLNNSNLDYPPVRVIKAQMELRVEQANVERM